jgi:FtsH-binding integral membrane protein
MEMNKVFSKVYMWMFIGLLATMLTGFMVSTDINFLVAVVSGPWFWVIILAELGIAIYFGARIHKMQPMTAKLLFLVYSILTGLTFGMIFAAYKLGSVLMIFGITAAMFLILSVLGFTTDIDLTKFRTVLLVGLVVIILSMFLNMFIQSDTATTIMTVVTLTIFIGLVAADTQKIKYMIEDSTMPETIAIYGAFELYLDFINIFLQLIKLFGESRD